MLPFASVDHIYTLMVNGSTLLPGGPALQDDVYYAGNHIACEPSLHFGGICLFMQGNVPSNGVLASLVFERLGDLQSHGCQTCGSVPISGDNDPDEMGILTLNYVTDSVCNGVC